MARVNTVVEILKPVYNEDGKLIDKKNEIFENGTDQEVQMKPEQYYLLHWGLETNFTHDQNGYPIPYSSTVGVCQHIKTGVIETFIPGVIKVLGKEVNNG